MHLPQKNTPPNSNDATHKETHPKSKNNLINEQKTETKKVTPFSSGKFSFSAN